MSFGKAILGGIKGAATGFLSGGPVGAIVGGGAGAVGGALDKGDKAAQGQTAASKPTAPGGTQLDTKPIAHDDDEGPALSKSLTANVDLGKPRSFAGARAMRGGRR